RATLFTASVASPSIMEGSHFMKLPPDGVDEFGVEGIRDCPYDIPNLRIEYSRQEPGGLQVWFWRSVGHSQNSFFLESFIDELAHAAGKDPYEFRRSLLGKQPRCRGALELAAEKAGWGKPLPAGVHRGIAVVFSFGSWCAQVAEVSVGADGTPKVHRVVAAVDCGMTVNPDIVRRQIESAVVYGLTAALYGKITFKDGRVELELPLVGENGHSVPMTVRVDSPMSEADYVRRIDLVSEKHPVPLMATLFLGPHMGRAEVESRVRLNGTQRVTAVAQLSDGS